MHSLAAHAPLAVGLSGEPPLSPQTIGRPPSNFDPPAVPVRSLEEIVGLDGEHPVEEQAPAPAPVEELPPAAAVALDQRRLVVRLLGGEDVELGTFDGPDAAIDRARELVTAIDAAESAGEWPELEGRFLRPGAIVSVDILVAD